MNFNNIYFYLYFTYFSFYLYFTCFNREPVPFVVQFKLAKQFDDLVVILLEFANMKV